MNITDVTEKREFSDESFQKLNLFETERMFSDVYCFEPGQEQTPHTHEDADKVYYVLEGEGTFIVGDEQESLSAGEAVIAKAGAKHGVRNDSDGNLRTLVWMARDTHPEQGESGHSHGHSHGHDHAHGDEGDHSHDIPHDHGEAAADAEFGIVTISSSRSESEDESGDTIQELIETAGYTVSSRSVVDDDFDAIQETVQEAIDAGADVVITTGGTGLTPDDLTVDALRPLFDREIPGFGEEFRQRSKEQVGLAGLLSRVTAGVIVETPVFVLPGSENAVRLGVEELVLPELDHLLHLVRR